MKRTVFDIIIASLLSLLAYILSAVVLAAIANSTPINKNLFISLVCTAAFSLALLYVSKVRNAVGEDTLFDDYKEHEYTTLKRDIPFVWAHERVYLIVICAIILLCLFINTIYMGLFDIQTQFPLAIAFFPMIAYTSLISFPSSIILNFAMYLISAIMSCSGYFLAVLLYRRKIWKNRNKY